jgi:hypothetical protein
MLNLSGREPFGTGLFAWPELAEVDGEARVGGERVEVDLLALRGCGVPGCIGRSRFDLNSPTEKPQQTRVPLFAPHMW